MENCFLPPAKSRATTITTPNSDRDNRTSNKLTLESLDALSLGLGLLGETRRSFHAFAALVSLLHDGAGTQHEGGHGLLFFLPRYIHQRPILRLQLNYVLERQNRR